MRNVILYEDGGGILTLHPMDMDVAIVVPNNAIRDGLGIECILQLAHTDSIPQDWETDTVAVNDRLGSPQDIDRPRQIAEYSAGPAPMLTIWPRDCGNAGRQYLGIPREEEYTE